jgi:FtsZ-interacting cell division protein ZipA
MFWIGLIVGVLIAAVALIAIIAWTFWATKMDLDEYRGYLDVVSAALNNRESTLQVYHNGELLDEVTFVEK